MQWFHQTAGRQRTIPFVFFSTPFARLDGNLKAAAHRFKSDDEGSSSKEKADFILSTKKFCLRITQQHCLLIAVDKEQDSMSVFEDQLKCKMEG